VCFEVDESEIAPDAYPCKFTFKYRSVVALGKVRFLDDPHQKRAVLTAMLEKYDKDKTANRPILELCVLGILRKEHSASTKRIIELASTPEFENVCRDCKSGVEVYETATKLQRAGLVTRKPGPVGFVWSLAEKSAAGERL